MEAWAKGRVSKPVVREGMSRVVWDGGEVRSTDEAGNDRGGKGPQLKE